MTPAKGARKGARKPAERKAASKGSGFTAEERAAMRERARELKAGKGDGERDLLSKVAAMPPPDRRMAERLHALVMDAAPGLEPRTWYGMPAYAKDGKVLCFFQAASKFKARYATFGFSDEARLDEGAMWPTSYALKELTPTAEADLRALVKRAVG